MIWLIALVFAFQSPPAPAVSLAPTLQPASVEDTLHCINRLRYPERGYDFRVTCRVTDQGRLADCGAAQGTQLSRVQLDAARCIARGMRVRSFESVIGADIDVHLYGRGEPH
jgi:hypothetical protein